MRTPWSFNRRTDTPQKKQFPNSGHIKLAQSSEQYRGTTRKEKPRARNQDLPTKQQHWQELYITQEHFLKI